jgi:hypothetical protein
MNARLLPLLALILTGCGTPAWSARTAETCPSTLGDPRSDQERAYLSSLLALDDRRYEVVHRESPRQIEATAQNRHYGFRTTWVIRVQPGGVLSIDQPENERETHEFTQKWFDQLTRSIESYRCRDLDWLRWNAENRGLVPVGDVMPSSGGEAVTRKAPPSATVPVDLSSTADDGA